MHQIASIKGHSERVWGLDFHKNLPLLASCSADKTVCLYNLSVATNSTEQDVIDVSLKLVTVLEGSHKRSIRAIAWKPLEFQEEGDIPPSIATASFDGTVGIWSPPPRDDQPGYNIQGEWEYIATLEGHENEVKSVAWSFDGLYIATCSRDKTVWIWETDPPNDDMECLAVLQEHTQDVKRVQWHPSEYLLASASYDDTIRLWREDDDDWTCCCTIKGHSSTVWDIDFEKNPQSQDSSRLVSVSDDESVKIWKRVSSTVSDKPNTGTGLPSIIRTGDPVHEEWVLDVTLPKVHTGAIYTVSWSGLSGRIASAGCDGKIAIYKYNSETKSWEIFDIQEFSHGVHEVNVLLWHSIDSTREILFSGGDDADVRCWQV